MSVTIHDVARRAGVSIATVSRVLNNTCKVREDKRLLVLEAARDLGYSPNPAALSLLNKKTGALGVLLPSVHGEFFSELLNTLDEAARENELILVISTSHRHEAEFQKAMQFLDKRVDGLIVMAPELDAPAAASILHTGAPVVFINTYAEGLPADVFNFDNYGGSRALTQHLLDQGHRKIALVLGPQTAGDAKERARGYRDAMAAAGIEDTDELEFEGGYDRKDGFVAAEAIVASTVRPTAILAANDYCAMGVVSALHALGIAVPDEIAVAGFDGLMSAKYGVPPLTTARVSIGEIGARAVGRLVARLNGELPEGDFDHQVVPVDLVVRASTATPVSV